MSKAEGRCRSACGHERKGKEKCTLCRACTSRNRTHNNTKQRKKRKTKMGKKDEQPRRAQVLSFLLSLRRRVTQARPRSLKATHYCLPSSGVYASQALRASSPSFSTCSSPSSVMVDPSGRMTASVGMPRLRSLTPTAACCGVREPKRKEERRHVSCAWNVDVTALHVRPK